MWPFKRKEPKFKVGDAVFFKLFEYGQTFTGTVRAFDREHRFPYIVEVDGIGHYADVAESFMRHRQQVSATDRSSPG